MYSSDQRCLILQTAQLVPKTTRSAQGAAVMKLKAKHRLARACFLEETPIQNPARYRARALPAAGAALRQEDRGEEQLTMEP